jgi:hypothetical protein
MNLDLPACFMGYRAALGSHLCFHTLPVRKSHISDFDDAQEEVVDHLGVPDAWHLEMVLE